MADYREEKRKFRIAQLSESIKILDKITWNLRMISITDAISWYFLKWKLRLMIRNMNFYMDIYNITWENDHLETSKNMKHQIDTLVDGISKIYDSEIKTGE